MKKMVYIIDKPKETKEYDLFKNINIPDDKTNNDSDKDIEYIFKVIFMIITTYLAQLIQVTNYSKFRIKVKKYFFI